MGAVRYLMRCADYERQYKTFAAAERAAAWQNDDNPACVKHHEAVTQEWVDGHWSEVE